MSEFGRELSVPPGAVRNQEIEQATLFARFLLLEERAGVSGEFKKFDTLGHVGLVRRLVLFDGSKARGMLASPVGRHAVERCCSDAAIQLIDIHRVQAVLQSGILGLEALDDFVVGVPFVLVALSQGRPHPVEHLRIEM